MTFYTEMVIGQVEQVHLPLDALKPDGYIDVEAMDLVTLSGLDSYHTTQRLFRLAYAKPDKPLSPLTVDGQESQWARDHNKLS